MSINFRIADVVITLHDVPSWIKTDCLSEFVCNEVDSDFVVSFLPWSDSICEDFLAKKNHINDLTAFIAGKKYQIVYSSASGIGAITVFDGKKQINCYISAEKFSSRITYDITRFFPLVELLISSGVTVLHSSQIRFNGKSILFTAPSGTGKSTQADLWKRTLSADIISGDRTAIRKFPSSFFSYGLPFDGSAKIINNVKTPLGAIIRLSQSKDNTVKRLTANEAFTSLYAQIAVYHEDEKLLSLGVDALKTITSDVPVYSFSCTPDVDAVNTLKNKLESDNII